MLAKLTAKEAKSFFELHTPSILAVLIWAWISRNGLKLTYDSVEYLHAAESFSKQGLLLHTNGEPFVGLSPLYALILSVFGQYAQTGAWWLHLFCLYITIWLWQRFAPFEGRLRFFFGLALAGSVGLQIVASFLWTEMLFMCGWIGFLYLQFEVLEPKLPKNKLKLSVDYAMILVLMMALPMQRNAGVFLMSALALYWFGANRKFFFRFVVLALPSALIFGLWLVNSDVSNTRQISTSERIVFFWNYACLYADVFVRWFFPAMLVSSSWLVLPAFLLFGYWLSSFKVQSKVSMGGFVSGFYVWVLLLVQIWIEFGQAADAERYMILIFPMALMWILDWIQRKKGQDFAVIFAGFVVFYSFLRLAFNVFRWEGWTLF
jgi:hypothetical protein